MRLALLLSVLLCLLLPLMSEERKVLLVLGDSLTAGMGLENPDAQAFPARLQELIDADKRGWLVVGAGVSGDTSAGGLRRIDWLLRRNPDALLLALGGNDGLRGLTTESTRDNLRAILDKVRAKNPKATLFLAGMQMPPNLGPEYTERYRALFPAVAEEKKATLIPFLLEGVGGDKELNQADGIHPTTRGHERIAAHLWRLMKDKLPADSAPAGN